MSVIKRDSAVCDVRFSELSAGIGQPSSQIPSAQCGSKDGCGKLPRGRNDGMMEWWMVDGYDHTTVQ